MCVCHACTQAMPVIVLPTPLPTSLLSMRVVVTIIFSTLKKKNDIQYFSFHLSDYIISVLINILQLWLLINMLFIAGSVLN